MIIGVSHVAVRSTDPERDRQALESQGWSTVFIDHEVRVHPYERPFLSSTHPEKQSLVLLRHPAGLPALELVSPVIGTSGKTHRTELDLTDSGKRNSQGVIYVPNLADTVNFFVEGLGFLPSTNKGLDFANLSLCRPLPQWSMRLTIREEAFSTEVTTLDSEGWFVLALLSSNPQADAAHAVKCNAKAVTNQFVTKVNEREWKIVLCVLSSGFAIELIQMAERSAGQ